MFIVIYSFQVKKVFEESFESAWEELTLLFRDYAGGLGSRLHKGKENGYIAYAQWPDEQTWENAQDLLPEEASEYRTSMENSCLEIKTLHKLRLVEDMLVKHP